MIASHTRAHYGNFKPNSICNDQSSNTIKILKMNLKKNSLIVLKNNTHIFYYLCVSILKYNTATNY